MSASRHYRNRSDRRRFWPPFPTLQTNITYVITAGASPKMRLTFSAPVVVTALPTLRRIDSDFSAMSNPTGYTIVSPTIVDFTYAVDPTGETACYFMRENDPNIRGVTGGFVTATPTSYIAP